MPGPWQLWIFSHNFQQEKYSNCNIMIFDFFRLVINKSIFFLIVYLQAQTYINKHSIDITKFLFIKCITCKPVSILIKQFQFPVRLAQKLRYRPLFEIRGYCTSQKWGLSEYLPSKGDEIPARLAHRICFFSSFFNIRSTNLFSSSFFSSSDRGAILTNFWLKTRTIILNFHFFRLVN